MDDLERADTEGDIEFEFFDDPPTSEAQPRGFSRAEERPSRPVAPRAPSSTQGSSPPPKRGPGRTQGGASPTLRLALLIAGLVLLAVIVVFVFARCGSGKKGEFQGYFESVSAIAVSSDSIGQETNTVLFSRALPTSLQAQLKGLGEQQQQLTQRVLALRVPPELVEQHESLVTAMQLRTNGLRGLSAAFGQLGELGSDIEAGQVLATQARRLTASDVVYADLFEVPARKILVANDVQGVDVPTSKFVESTDTLTESTMTELISNLGGASESSSGLRGTSLISVTVQPVDLQLSPSSRNTLTLSSDLAFAVLVRNSGDMQLTDVRVRFTLQQQGDRVRKSKIIDVLNPDQERIVLFGDFTDLNIAEPSVLTIAVLPVEGESNLDNNSEAYDLILSLS